MKALILNFSAFDNKDKTKSYFKFGMFDLEQKQLYDYFTEQKFCAIPNGEVPNKEDIAKTFPRIANVDFSIVQYTNKECKIVYQPRVNAILDWKKAEIK